jgi:hypothetical protein
VLVIVAIGALVPLVADGLASFPLLAMGLRQRRPA